MSLSDRDFAICISEARYGDSYGYGSWVAVAQRRRAEPEIMERTADGRLFGIVDWKAFPIVI